MNNKCKFMQYKYIFCDYNAYFWVFFIFLNKYAKQKHQKKPNKN